MRASLVLSLLGSLTLAACGGGGPAAPTPGDGVPKGPAIGSTIECGLVAPYAATLVLDMLRNPSCVSFSPKGVLTVCDGYGSVWILDTKGGRFEFVNECKTEFWKVDPATNVSRFQLGPLSAVWMGETLAVTDAGQPDGTETIHFFTEPQEMVEGQYTNAVGPTTDDPKDRGEGNLTGLAVGPDNDTLWVCGQGSDAKTWVLRAQLSTKKLEPWLSADDNGITVNSPMQVVVEDAAHILVLYSGAGGKEDGLIVRWNVETRKPEAQWTLPGLVDPMGMARIPGSAELAVVDNNWALTEVKDGKLARVTLPESGGAATVTIIGTQLRGPVSCAFGPDGKLYIAQLGTEMDKAKGQVLAITGF